MSMIRSTWLDSIRDVLLAGEATPLLLAGLLAASIAADDVLSVSVDLAIPWIRLTNPLAGEGAVVDAGSLLDRHRGHPAIASWFASPLDRTPRRLSDLVPVAVWTSGSAYRSVFHESRARFQLAIVTDLVLPDQARGWILTRSDGDFSDADVETAGRLVPLLAVAAGLAARSREIPDTVPRILTDRELSILGRVAAGASAIEIATSLAISPLTVRKHLEHVYRKLGCRDRVHAVNRARDLGLLNA